MSRRQAPTDRLGNLGHIQTEYSYGRNRRALNDHEHVGTQSKDLPDPSFPETTVTTARLSIFGTPFIHSGSRRAVVEVKERKGIIARSIIRRTQVERKSSKFRCEPDGNAD